MTAAIIQARMGSTRLPGKMLMDIVGKPVIQHVCERLKKAKMIDEIWLATANDKINDRLAKWAFKNKIPCFRGSENDVLDRYYQTALKADADVVVRITGDCPLLDFMIVDRIIREFKKGDYDYVCNTLPPTYPDGLDVEVFSFSALKKAWKEAKLKSEREHVTIYIKKHPELFKIKNISNEADLSHYRWTLDTKEDLDLIRLIAGECQKKKEFCGLKEILKITNEHPDWLKINQHYQRNEGYAKSLIED